MDCQLRIGGCCLTFFDSTKEPLRFESVEVPERIHSCGGKEYLLKFVSWFSTRTEHGSGKVYQKIFACIRGVGDAFDLMESLLEGGD